VNFAAQISPEALDHLYRQWRSAPESLPADWRQTAMATTFNEADLGRIAELRRKHGENFQRRHGVKLGLLPFFIKACAEALQELPEVNARIDGNDIVYQHFYAVGIAVAAEKGLLVPVIREVPCRDFADLQKTLDDFAARPRSAASNWRNSKAAPFPSATAGGTGRPGGHPADDEPGPELRPSFDRRSPGGGISAAGQDSGGGTGGDAAGAAGAIHELPLRGGQDVQLAPRTGARGAAGSPLVS
jgi:hypothetical protein